MRLRNGELAPVVERGPEDAGEVNTGHDYGAFFLSQQVEAYFDGWWYTAEVIRLSAGPRTYTLRWTFARGFRPISQYQARYMRPARHQ
jgi:hypothetical protein